MGNEDVNPFYGRIEQIADYYGLTLRGLSVKLGLPSPQIFYDMKSGKIKNLSGKIIKAIQENLPEVNILWVMMGVESMLTNSTQKNKIPLYDDVATIGGNNDQVANVDDSARPTEWIDAGDWFPTATSAIHHYGDSMNEYPSGCILALKRVNDSRLLLNGENYVIETDEFRITKRILDDGDDIIAYSTNQETYPDGRLVHAPIRIPKDAIRHLDLVLGCVIRKFSTPVRIR